MRQVLFNVPLPSIPVIIPILVLAVALAIGYVRKFGSNYFTTVSLIFGLLIVGSVLRGRGIEELPIYGYGAMLFVAFVFAVWVATRLGVREGISPQRIMDLALWILLSGLAGGRITYMIQYGVPLVDFYRLWEGGLVFYGAAIGGVVGYFLAHFYLLRKEGISVLKMADIIAPAAAIGLALGRVGCLMNGCCYGNVACPDCPAVSFPLSGQPRYDMVRRGYQTAAGFTLENQGTSNRVAAVEPDSAAAEAGLRPGDEITGVNGKETAAGLQVAAALGPEEWKRGENNLMLHVKRANGAEEDMTFSPQSLPLHPTQIYESISTLLLFFLLWSFYPFKGRPGTVMVLLMLCYAVHRFLDEMLRTDTRPVAFDMTLSENISIAVFLAGVILGLWIWLRRPRMAPPAASAV